MAPWRAAVLVTLLVLGYGCRPDEDPLRVDPGEEPPALAEFARHPAARRAAEAARRQDLREIFRTLGADTAGNPSSHSTARLVAGLHAWAAHDLAIARTLLGEGPVERIAVRSAIDDWRLYALGNASSEVDPVGSIATFGVLLDRHPRSPLAPPASLEALELALATGDEAGARRLLARARRLHPAPVKAGSPEERLARLAWRHAVGADRKGLTRAAGRALLRDAPDLAADLEVLGHLEETELPSWMSGADRRTRAENLIHLGRATEALETLESIPRENRDNEWRLLRARSLAASGKGREALALLDSMEGEIPIGWSCAEGEAAARTAAPGRGRRSPPRARRQALEERARQAFADCALAATDEEGEVSAWRRLLEIATRTEDVPATDLALSALASDDPLVVDYRWQRGWQAYGERSFAAALDHWGPLAEDSARSWRHRAARYWSIDAYRELGQSERAEVIADRMRRETSIRDFYRHHLADGDGPRPALSTTPQKQWPTDERLDRARLLLELGLDRLAQKELELLGEAVDPVAAHALEARLLAGQGRTRSSILPLIRAFPELGTAEQDSAPEAALELYYPLSHWAEIERWSRERGLEPALVLALIRQESAFDTGAVSRSGARGLMQLMPPTAMELAEREGLAIRVDDLHRPEINVRLATSYLVQVLEMFDGNVELALAGYNAGPYRIRRWWREAGPGARVDRFVEGLPIEEPRVYVKRILLLADSYRWRLEEPGNGEGAAPQPTFPSPLSRSGNDGE